MTTRIPRSYDEITRHTVPDPDSSFRPSREQEAAALLGGSMSPEEAELFTRIHEAFLQAPDVAVTGVVVDVDRTHVVLRGRVLDVASVQRLEDIAESVEGVTKVDNFLVVGVD